MTSPPSRSRASTRMSRPNMTGPTSARPTGAGFGLARAVAAVFFVLAVVFVLLITFCCWPAFGGRRNKKPTTVASRGCLSKSFGLSTSANGVANYNDDQQDYLPNTAIYGADTKTPPASGQARILSGHIPHCPS